jgi:hypothetical protein
MGQSNTSRCVTIRWWYGIARAVYLIILQRIPVRQRYTQHIDKPNMSCAHVRYSDTVLDPTDWRISLFC